MPVAPDSKGSPPKELPEALQDRRRLMRRLTALFGLLVVSLLVLDTNSEAMGPGVAATVGIAVIALFLAATGHLAFRAGVRGGSLSDHAPEILKELSVGVVLTDAEFRVLHANPAFARMAGRAPEAVAGLRIKDAVYPADQATYEREVARRAGGHSDTYRIRLAGAGGKPLHVLISARPVLRNGKFAGALALIHDVSATVEARVEAAEARNLSGFLFDAFTHDLSNSLQVVLGRLAAAEALSNAGNARAPQAVAAARAAADRAAKELREIKQIARSETEQWPRRPARAGELVQEAIVLADLDATVVVVTDMQASAAAAQVLASDLGALAIAKLIEEASSHGGTLAPRNVTVELRAGELGASTVLVRVHGCRVALPIEDLTVVLNSATDAPTGGLAWRSGVRLVLAATIAKPHGWTVRALREENGAGTVFEMRMPAAPPVTLITKRRVAVT